jgi:hypothetical protein
MMKHRNVPVRCYGTQIDEPPTLRALSTDDVITMVTTKSVIKHRYRSNAQGPFNGRRDYNGDDKIRD